MDLSSLQRCAAKHWPQQVDCEAIVLAFDGRQHCSENTNNDHEEADDVISLKSVCTCHICIQLVVL